MFHTIVICSIVGALIVGFALIVAVKKRKENQSLPYCRNALMSQAEKNFFKVLLQTVGDGFLITFKVRLADIISVRPGTNEKQLYQNKINSKHVDFLICDKNDLSAKFAVELDDSSHNAPSRVTRDDFVNEVFNAAGIPLFRFTVKREYSTEDVRQKITEAMSPPVEVNEEQMPQTPKEPICNKCGASMILRTAQKGENAGQKFWGCSNYPKCRNVVKV